MMICMPCIWDLQTCPLDRWYLRSGGLRREIGGDERRPVEASARRLAHLLLGVGLRGGQALLPCLRLLPGLHVAWVPLRVLQGLLHVEL